MQQTSEQFKQAVTADTRHLTARIIKDGNIIEDNILSLQLTTQSNSADNLTIGSVVSAYIDAEVYHPGFTLEGYEVEVQIALALDETWQDGETDCYEWLSFGYFTVQKPEDSEETIRFTAYDRMMKTEKPYFSDLPASTNTIAILSEISEQIGVEIVTDNLTPILMSRPEGYTCREVLAYVAQLHGKFAICDRTGRIVLKWYEDSEIEVIPDKYPSNEFLRQDFNYILEKIEVATGTVETEEGEETVSISSGEGVRAVSFSNPFMTQEILDNVFAEIGGFTYMPGVINLLQADPRMDPWDVIIVYDLQGNKYRIPCMQMVLDYDGGFSGSIEAPGHTEEEDELNFKGPITQMIDRMSTKLLLVDYLMANRISVEYLQANYASITALDVVHARIDVLEAHQISVEYLEANYATINWVQANYASITELNAVYGNITLLESEVAGINTLLNGNLTSNNIQSLHLTATYVTVEDAFIKDAMIANLSADKITAGTIITNNVNVRSENGQLHIADNTIQIKDDADTARVQIGEDAAGDYSMYVWDDQGKLMFDALGLREDGIKSGIIKDSMVSDSANIAGHKVDIESLVTEVNNAEYSIKSSKIRFDGTDQSLNIYLGELKEQINAIETHAGDYVLQTWVEGSVNESGRVATIHARVFHLGKEVTESFRKEFFRWSRRSEYAEEDEVWNRQKITGYSITLTGEDVEMIGTYVCSFMIPDNYYWIDEDTTYFVDTDGNRLMFEEM